MEAFITKIKTQTGRLMKTLWLSLIDHVTQWIGHDTIDLSDLHISKQAWQAYQEGQRAERL